MQLANSNRLLTVLVILCLVPGMVFGATPTHKKKRAHKAATVHPAAHAAARPATKTAAVGHSARLAASSHAPITHASRLRASSRRVWSPWTEPTFADSTSNDFIDGDDLTVRRAAVEALGPYNGTVVVADPNNGRIMTMVNQKLALKSGFQPCSTIKIVAALAGLSEGLIERNTIVRIYGRTRLGLTEAIAHSNNPYFAKIGEGLGFDKVSYYAHLFGLGEKAGLNIPGEEPGILPDSTPEPGMGMMTSFGSGISLTPLELAGLMSAIANGGTLYYLQYPRSREEIASFVPRVKRRLDIGPWIPEIKPGMMGAVEYGTARRANYDPNEPILGKTGTCTDSKSPTHLGWFGSFNDVGKNKLVVVVLLTGGRGVNGPIASGIAGQVYRNLSAANYFQKDRGGVPLALVSTGNCCAVKAGSE
jgi:cell division protein FtsI/penicillin-binding protein 2